MTDDPCPEGGPRFVRLLDPWRCETFDPASGRAVLARRGFDRSGRRLPRPARATVAFGGAGLSAPVCRALLAYVSLGKLSPPHLQALVDERRAQSAAPLAPGAGAVAADLASLFAGLGAGASEGLDDAMAGVLTGPLQHAVAGDRAGLVAVLDHACTLPAGRAERAIGAYAGLFLRARPMLVAAALRLAESLPSIPRDAIRADRDLFAWWRGQCTVPVRVEGVDGQTVQVLLPEGVPKRLAAAVGRMLGTLCAAARDAGELLGHPARQPRGLAQAIAVELNDGLVGLLVNDRGRGAAAGAIETALVCAGTTPARAAWCKALAIDGARLDDALGRFFAVPHATVALPRTGASVVVWRTGCCPFPDAGLMAAAAEASHPAWLPGIARGRGQGLPWERPAADESKGKT